MLVGVVLWALVLAVVRTQQSPPHIVFIFMDDLGWHDIGYHGSEIMVRFASLQTPICLCSSLL